MTERNYPGSSLSVARKELYLAADSILGTEPDVAFTNSKLQKSVEIYGPNPESLTAFEGMPGWPRINGHLIQVIKFTAGSLGPKTLTRLAYAIYKDKVVKVDLRFTEDDAIYPNEEISNPNPILKIRNFIARIPNLEGWEEFGL